eukprot:7142533-Prymnesium_polylepis.1
MQHGGKPLSCTLQLYMQARHVTPPKSRPRCSVGGGNAKWTGRLGMAACSIDELGWPRYTTHKTRRKPRWTA